MRVYATPDAAESAYIVVSGGIVQSYGHDGCPLGLPHPMDDGDRAIIQRCLNGSWPLIARDGQ